MKRRNKMVAMALVATMIANSSFMVIAKDNEAVVNNYVTYENEAENQDKVKQEVVVNEAETETPEAETPETEIPETDKPDVESPDIESLITKEGWNEINGRKYYADENLKLKTGWLELDGKKYYLDAEDPDAPGAAVCNTAKVIDKKTYHFNEECEMITGWHLYEDNWYYIQDNGDYTVDWKYVDGYWYYFNQDGCMMTGWEHVDGYWYYFNQNGCMITGWKNVDGYWYYFNQNGCMITGWKYVDGYWYYFNQNGCMITGWKNLDGYWYYFNKAGVMAKGWFSDEGYWYYANAAGVMQTGWVHVGNYWYYMNQAGVMQTGWLYIDGDWYYMYKSGEMASNTVIDGYRLSASGAMVTPSTAMKNVINGYSSSTNYLIAVDRKACRAGIFTGSKGKWSNKYFWPCTVGAPSSPTISGVYKVQGKQYTFGMDKGYSCWYCTQIRGNYLFHSVIYAPGSKTNIRDGRLGMQLSHGCVRLKLENAKWMYDNIPIGTTIVIYN